MQETPPPGRTLPSSDVELVALDGPDEGSAITLLPGELTIGRSAPCDVIIDSRLVSKVHARVRRASDHLVIDDLKSQNGTLVNGKRVQTSQALRDGDLISIAGLRQYRVRIAPRARRAAAPKPPEATLVRPRDVSVHLHGPAGEFTLKAGSHVVGRDPDVAVFLDHREISRAHAVISVVGLRITVEDRDSANGTTVNGELVKSPRTLRSGDKIGFGDLEFTVAINTGL